MTSRAGGLDSGLGHSLGPMDGSQTFTSHTWENNSHVPGEETFPGDAMDWADVISSQTQINRLLHEIKTLEAQVAHWKGLSQCSTQGPDTTQPDRTWQLESTIRDLEERRMREMEEHQLGVAVLQNIHQQKLADLAERHRKQLIEYQKRMEDLQNQDSAGNGKEDVLQERETELRGLKQQLTETERLNDHLNNVASDLRAENQKLVSALQDVRHQLEESILRNNEDSLQNNIAVRALKIEKGRLVAKLCRAEKKLSEETSKSEQPSKELPSVERAHFIQLGQEKDLEILQLRKRIGQMDADHKETKGLLSSALEEQKQLTRCIKEKDMYIEELRGRPELREEFGQSTQALRSNDVLQPSVKDKDVCLPSVTGETPPGNEDLEHLRQQSRTVPVVDPKILDEIVELQCEVFELQELNDRLEEEIKEQQKIIHNQQQGKLALLQSLQEQKQKVDRLQNQQEQMNMEHAQLLSAKDEQIQNLQDTIEQMKAQLPDKSPRVNDDLERLRQQSASVPVVDPKILDDLVELECEVFELKGLKDDLEEKIKVQKKIIDKQEQGQIALLQSLQEQKQEVDHPQHRQQQVNIEHSELLSAKDEQIRNLQDTIEEMKAQLPDKTPQIARERLDDVEVRTSQPLPGENGSEKQDPSNVGTQRLLVRGIKEQEWEMKLAPEQNMQLTEQMDRPSLEEIGKLIQIIQQTDLEIQGLSSRISTASLSQNGQVERLQRQLQEYALKNEQVLVVLDEKTRENSNLKRDYHKMTDRLAVQEADLRRMQEDNQKLSARIESSGQDMFRETIQNLSHIIREKDLEVDGLSQKCQTLLSILQTCGTGHEVGGVPVEEFKQLLQERVTLKQRVKIMEEWKQQVLTTVQNMKRESPQLQRDLRQLQARAFTNSEKVLKLQTASVDLIQTHKGNEVNLQHLEKELAHIQLRIGELCNAKDLLLGKLDAIFLQASSDSSQSADSLKALESDLVSESSRLLQEEVEELRKSVQEKEEMMRTLQEDKQRWIESGAAMSEGEGKLQEHSASDVEQLKEKQAFLQNLVQDQEVRIQAKSEELLSLQENFSGQLSENELLRQAVTNLKERIADFEVDVCQLKEENAKLVEIAREKETEKQALQETNRLLSMMRREEASQHAAMKEKVLALEQLLQGKEEKEEGETGELNRLVDAVPSTQEKTAVCQRERDEVVLALKQKDVETCALQEEVRQLRERELRLTRELERGRHLASEAEESHRREALASEDQVAQLRKEVTVLQGELVLSSTAMEKASRGASVQVESLREQLHVVTRQKEETALRLAASQDEGKHYAQSLANLKLELAEWMEKADTLEGNLKSLQGRLHKTNADLDLKEDQLQEVRRQNEVQQEILEDTQKKLMTLVSNSEGMVDKTLLRRLLMGSFQAPEAQRQEALRSMGSMLGIREDHLRQLFGQEPGGVTSRGTGGPGSKSAPNTPAKPNHQAVANNSLSGLFVQFLEAESHPAFPPPKSSAHDVKPPDSGGRGKLAKKQGPACLSTTLGSTPPKKDVKPRTTAVSLINPPGPETDGSEHLLLSAVTDTLPRYLPQLLSPAKKVGMAARHLSKR